MRRRIISKTNDFSFQNCFQTNGGLEKVNNFGITPLNLATSFSLHAWINVESGNEAMIGYQISGTLRLAILKNSAGGIFGVNDSDLLNGGTYNEHGNWALISFTFQGGGTSILYVNGVDVDSISSSVSTTLAGAGNNFTINQYGTRYGTAAYDEIVLTSDVSTPSQILDYYNSGNGKIANDCFTNIVSYWRCNESSPSATLADIVGGYNGNIRNMSFPPDYFVDHFSV